MAIIGGFLAARFGPRIVITLALVLMGVTMILTGLANSFSFAFGGQATHRPRKWSCVHVPAMALGSAWFSVQRRWVCHRIVSAGIGGGTMIAGIVVPVILGAYGTEGWRFVWYYLGAAVLLIAIIAGLVIRNRPENLGLHQLDRKPGSPEIRRKRHQDQWAGAGSTK